ncbi:hypothetical protein BGZ96_005664, partial [Linnemannia gamsii]
QPKEKVPDVPWATDIAQKPYYGCDVRKNYPHLAVYSQEWVAGLIAAKVNKELSFETGETSLVKEGKKDLLTEVLKNTKAELYSSSNLPSTLGVYKDAWGLSPYQPPVAPGEQNNARMMHLVIDDCEKCGCADLIFIEVIDILLIGLVIYSPIRAMKATKLRED